MNKNSGWLAALCTSLVLSCAPAMAQQDPRIVFTMVPYPDGNATTLASSTTLSSSRYNTEVAYRVRVVNNTTNTLNRVKFRATTSVVGATTNTSVIASSVYVQSGLVAPCTQPTGPTSLQCAIGTNPGTDGGTLLTGQSAEFWVVVRTPTTGTKLVLNGAFGGDEGNGGGNGCCDSLLTRETTLVHAVVGSSDLNAPFKNALFSFVGTPGGRYFTGASGFPTADDPWSTTVEVPTVTNGLLGLPFTTASVVEQPDLQSCSAVNRPTTTVPNPCNRSDLTIPGTFASLVITLRQHPSIIRNGSKITDWKIAYSKTPGTIAYTEVQACSITGGPTAGIPCIDACQEYTSKTVPAVPKSLWGIFECRIKAIDNGGYKVQ